MIAAHMESPGRCVPFAVQDQTVVPVNSRQGAVFTWVFALGQLSAVTTPSRKFSDCVCKPPIASKAPGPLWGRRRGGPLRQCFCIASAQKIRGRNGDGFRPKRRSLGGISAGCMTVLCPSYAHTRTAAARENRRAPNVLDPHE